jgi:Putative Flp pilus-assembly TadE/G-like
MANQLIRRLRNIGKQQGQALLWFLATAATTTGILVAVYNVGQITSEKQKLVNATDAAAYSGAMTEARTLNLTAYTNRTIIANEIFTAQIISLDSLTSYVARTRQNFANVATALFWIPPIAAVASAMRQLSQVANQIARIVDQTANLEVPAANALALGWITAFNITAFTPPTMSFAAKNVAQSVLNANAVTFGGRNDVAPQIIEDNAVRLLTLVENEISWDRFSRTYSGNDRNVARDLVLRSRDPFVANRPGQSFPVFGTWDAFFFGGEKRGATTLQNYDRWVAQDTVEFWVRKFGFFSTSKSYMPVGWGRASTPSRGIVQNTPGNAGRFALNENHNVSGWSGIKNHVDVNRAPRGQLRPLTYTLVVSKPANSLPTNEKLGFANKDIKNNLGSVGVTKKLSTNDMVAIGKARIFFERPSNRADFTANGAANGLFRGTMLRSLVALLASTSG